jgi:hypothetical protein
MMFQHPVKDSEELRTEPLFADLQSGLESCQTARALPYYPGGWKLSEPAGKDACAPWRSLPGRLVVYST